MDLRYLRAAENLVLRQVEDDALDRALSISMDHILDRIRTDRLGPIRGRMTNIQGVDRGL